MTTDPKGRNIVWHKATIEPWELEQMTGHKGATLWFTGLPSSGKSTLANAVARVLMDNKIHTIVLDGDNIRHGLNNNLGFSKADRTENIRRIGEVAKLFSSAAIVNLVAFVSPIREDREAARALQPERFIEVYCRAPLGVCEKRDPKGLYRRARAGEIPDFTGIGAPYEPPVNPEIILDTATYDVDICAGIVIDYIVERSIAEIRKQFRNIAEPICTD